MEMVKRWEWQERGWICTDKKSLYMTDLRTHQRSNAQCFEAIQTETRTLPDLIPLQKTHLSWILAVIRELIRPLLENAAL